MEEIIQNIPPEFYAMIVISVIGLGLILMADLGGWGERNFTSRMKGIMTIVGSVIFVAGIILGIIFISPAVSDYASWSIEISNPNLSLFFSFLAFWLIVLIPTWYLYRFFENKFPNREIIILQKRVDNQSKNIDRLMDVIKEMQDIVAKLIIK